MNLRRGSKHVSVLALSVCLTFAHAVQVTAAAAEDETAVAEAVSHYGQGRFAQARELFEPSAKSGNVSAQYHMGLMNARGEGGEKSLSEAARWFTLAAEQGHNHSQFLMGHMYANGEGVAKSLPLAHMWFTAAAANGWWKAREARERLVDAGMTPGEISEAGKLYRAFEARRSAK